MFDAIPEINGLHVSASIGIAIAPSHAKDLETLYKKADFALYKSKRMGKNRYCVYSKKKAVSLVKKCK